MPRLDDTRSLCKKHIPITALHKNHRVITGEKRKAMRCVPNCWRRNSGPNIPIEIPTTVTAGGGTVVAVRMQRKRETTRAGPDASSPARTIADIRLELDALDGRHHADGGRQHTVTASGDFKSP